MGNCATIFGSILIVMGTIFLILAIITSTTLAKLHLSCEERQFQKGEYDPYACGRSPVSYFIPRYIIYSTMIFIGILLTSYPEIIKEEF